MPYAQVPDAVILDGTLSPLARRLYEYIALMACQSCNSREGVRS